MTNNYNPKHYNLESIGESKIKILQKIGIQFCTILRYIIYRKQLMTVPIERTFNVLLKFDINTHT